MNATSGITLKLHYFGISAHNLEKTIEWYRAFFKDNTGILIEVYQPNKQNDH